MKIAVPFENGQVFQHFGHTSHFKIYLIEGKTVLTSFVMDTGCTGHEALTDFLRLGGINVLICGGIGGGAVKGLQDLGIAYYGGVKGDADQAVDDYLAGKLIYDPDVGCEGHGIQSPCHGHDGCGSCADCDGC